MHLLIVLSVSVLTYAVLFIPSFKGLICAQLLQQVSRRKIKGEQAFFRQTWSKTAAASLCRFHSQVALERRQRVDGECGWMVSALTMCVPSNAIRFQWMLQKDYSQTLQTTAACSVSEFDPPWRDGGRRTTSFTLRGWKLLTHRDDMLSELHRGPRWAIGSYGGADIGIKPVSGGIKSVSERVRESGCVSTHLKPVIQSKSQFCPHKNIPCFYLITEKRCKVGEAANPSNLPHVGIT